jgi:histone H2A
MNKMMDLHNINIYDKKSKFFESYIYKVLKKISVNNGITSNARQQLNHVICLICKLICETSIKLIKMSEKRIISIDQVYNSLKLIMSKELLILSDNIGNSFTTIYLQNDSKGLSRQKKATIIFPPSIVEKFLRDFGCSKYMVSNTSPVYLASVLQYLTSEILEKSIQNVKNKKHVRVTIRDIEIGVRKDEKLNRFFVQNNIILLGGGVIPYIHPNLLTKQDKKHSQRKKNVFKSGTISIREIRKFQKISNCLTCTKLPFQTLTREIFTNLNDDKKLKITNEVFIVLQYFIEQQIVNLLKCANLSCINSGRTKVTAKDITFVFYIKNNMDNSYNNSDDEMHMTSFM